MDETRGRADDVLTVVEHKQELALPQVVDQDVAHRSRALGLDAEGGRHGGVDQGTIGKRGKLHEPDTVAVVLDQTTRNLEREPSLSPAAHPREGEEPPLVEQLLNRCHLGLAPDEAGYRARQVVAASGDGLQRRKRVRKRRVAQLKDVFGTAHVA